MTVPALCCALDRALGTVDQIGTSFEADFIATGLGKHVAIPLMRSRWRADLTESEARALLEDCARVLYYRDCRAINKVRAMARWMNTGGWTH